MADGFSMKVEIGDLNKGLIEYSEKALAAVDVYGKTAAAKLEGKAKENRPWTDRTGDARKRMKGSSEMDSDGLKIVLAHGVDYGVWLELAHEKRYAIVEPTVRLDSNEIFQNLRGLLDRIHVR